MNQMSFCYHGFRIGLSDIVTAFDEKTIGSKVVDTQKFMVALADAMEVFDWSTCRQPGQGYIQLPKETCAFVSGGVGHRTQDPDDYVIRVNRGDVGLYLKRFRDKWVPEPRADRCDGRMRVCGNMERVSLAAPVDNVAVVVYTLAAYVQDPDCSDDERKRVMDMGLTHVLVAVLASSGKPSTLTAHRFVHNLAGGNNEALAWTADEIRQKAKEIKDFTSEWGVVAD